MESLTPFIRHQLEDAPGPGGPPEAASSQVSPPLGSPPVEPPADPNSPDIQLPPPEIEQPHIAMTDGTPVDCRQKNATEYLAGRSPGIMAQYGDGLFGAEQHTESRQPAPDDSDGVLQLVEWREEAPYG